MSQNSFVAKTLRFIGMVLMTLTGGFTLLGGIGTTCAALFPTKFGGMAALAPFQWLYILFVPALFTLTIQYLMVSTHTWDGVNYADGFNAGMTLTRIGLLLFGSGILVGVGKVRDWAGRFEVQAGSE